MLSNLFLLTKFMFYSRPWEQLSIAAAPGLRVFLDCADPGSPVFLDCAERGIRDSGRSRKTGNPGSGNPGKRKFKVSIKNCDFDFMNVKTNALLYNLQLFNIKIYQNKNKIQLNLPSIFGSSIFKSVFSHEAGISSAQVRLSTFLEVTNGRRSGRFRNIFSKWYSRMFKRIILAVILIKGRYLPGSCNDRSSALSFLSNLQEYILLTFDSTASNWNHWSTRVEYSSS